MLPVRLGDQFLWALGIEDTFIGQPGRTGRILDEYALTQHYRFWREDLERISDIGVRWMRYGIPWYRVNPAPGRFDWSWTDEVLPFLAERLGIQPILDLMHYGCPLWLEGQFVDPDYPKRVAEYAAAVAHRYHGIVPAYTPLNEPVVNALFCGRNGRWPPYLRGVRGYVRVLGALVEGLSRTIAAIRSEQPEATIVQVEASGGIDGTRHIDYRSAHSLDQHFLPTELVLGRVNERHPLFSWLVDNGASIRQLEWLQAHGETIDVMGVNFYPQFRSARRVALADEFTAIESDMVDVLTRFHARFDVPVILTETSDIAGVDRRSRWMAASVRAVADARARGVPVVGYIWFPAYSCFDWRYRTGRKPDAAYLLHMGLWELRPNVKGELERHRTRLVDQFAELIAGGAPVARPLGDRVDRADRSGHVMSLSPRVMSLSPQGRRSAGSVEVASHTSGRLRREA